MNIRDILLSQKTGLPIGDMQSILFAKATGGGGGGTGDFATDSWDYIAKVIASGKGIETYGTQIGVPKTITLSDGNTVDVRIVSSGQNLYKYTGTDTYAPFVFDFAKTFYGTQGYMFSKTNSFVSWKDSPLRTETIPVIFALLPSDLAKVIKPVDVRCFDGEGGSELVTSDKLFIPCEREYLPSRLYSTLVEWEAYAQWQGYPNNSSRTKSDISGTARTYWERSPRDSASYPQYKGAIQGNNGVGNTNAPNAKNAVCPAFCI